MKVLNKVLMSFALLSMTSLSALAMVPDIPPQIPPLSQISYQVTVEKWAATKTAKVTVSLDAALNKMDLAHINDQVQENLKKIAPTADWHITQFVRSQDKSGLEMLHVEAEARLPGDALAAIRDKAKSASKDGQTYSVSNVEFSPGQAEIEQAYTAARAEIYAQVKQEIAALNKVYPEQHYFVYAVNFSGNTPAPMMAAEAPRAMLMTASGSSDANAVSTVVNAKVVQTASVVIGSKLPHSPQTDVVEDTTTASAASSVAPTTPAPANKKG
ncbi:MAG: hypothetical protein QM752_08200 [Gammaproteobacteria bacterium]